jgi:two-component system, OmpR family, sensor histidine kinase ChvG
VQENRLNTSNKLTTLDEELTLEASANETRAKKDLASKDLGQSDFIHSPISSAPPAPFTKRVIASFRKMYRLTLRRISSSLSRRIMLLNMAGLVAMLLGFLWLIQTRESVIDARMQSLSTQAEIISAAIAASASVDTDGIKIDPEKLLSLQAGETGDVTLDFGKTIEFSLNPERVAPVLRRLVTPTRTRARIYDTDANLLLDTKDFYTKGDISRRTLPAPDDSATLFQRSWNSLKRKFGKTYISRDDDVTNGKFAEVKTALSGTSTSLVRVNTDGQTTVFVAVPIMKLKSVPGALLLSTQEGDIDDVIAAERISILMLFIIAASVMIVLSFLLAGTIAEPVRRLADAADRVRRGTKTRQEIPDFTSRSDEIGHLSGALREMTNSLYNRIEAIESFAADVAHELKNPLTSLRSAVETLPLAKSEDSKKRLLDVIHHDVKRLDRLISDISDASRLDADLQRNDMETIQLDEFLHTLVSAAQDLCIHNHQLVTFIFEKPNSLQKKNQFIIQGYASRLGQVISNLFDNAVSFSPPNSIIRVGLIHIDGELEIMIDDQGPGIPIHSLERVFERFYTDRPDHGFGQNSGLGLSISRQIIEAHKGRIWAQNRYNQSCQIIGARFIIRLPVLNA